MISRPMKKLILRLWYVVSDFYKLQAIRSKYKLSIMNSTQTIDYIQKNSCSIARYGDGEFDLMLQIRPEGYQEISDNLSDALRRVFQNQSKQLLICLPYPIVSTKGLKKHGKKYWRGWCLNRQPQIVSELRSAMDSDYQFGDAFVSRPFSGYESREYSAKLFSMLKELWQDKNILFVEGEKTRLGVENDLFDNARSIKRILCPAENAFDAYHRILDTILSHWQGELVILALGPTATVLASELSTKGIQSLDLGHIDIQYEWYLSGTSFVPVKGKYTNEVLGGCQVELCNDETYLSQIIAKVK